MNKVFFDANIINDIYDTKRPNASKSFSSVKKCLESGARLFTTCDIVTNVYYITAKYTHSINALDALEDVEDIFTILPFDNTHLKEAITLMREDCDYSDLEDTIQYILAKQSGCEIIISNDKTFVSKEVQLLSAEEFLKLP